MKPHEEEWSAGFAEEVEDGKYVNPHWSLERDAPGQDPLAQFHPDYCTIEVCEARAKLAAQAPAMARALIEAWKAIENLSALMIFKEHPTAGDMQQAAGAARKAIPDILRAAGVIP